VVHDSAAVHTMQWNAYFYLRAPSKNEEFLYFRHKAALSS
jgi:sarcosine oxidase delta subunit